MALERLGGEFASAGGNRTARAGSLLGVCDGKQTSLSS